MGFYFALWGIGVYNKNMKIINRKAFYDYHILEKFEAGIVLTGPEVKSLKEGKASLDDAFVQIKDNQALLINGRIHPYKFADNRDYDPTRTRKLLLHKKEITSLLSKTKQSNLTIVPTAWYTIGQGVIKIELALARGKKKYDKREAIKRKDLQRETEQILRGKI